jgi:RNA polymerase sigma factor (sigma-70 family)
MDIKGFHDLVRRAKAGDRKAMDEVLERLTPQLTKMARPYADPARRVGSTQDLLQDSCLRAWLKLDSFEGGSGDEETFAMFRAWIGQIVKRLGINAERDRKRQRRMPDKGFIPLGAPLPGQATSDGGVVDPLAREGTPSEYARADERAEKIQAALEKVEDETGASIVRQRFFEGRTLREIAERLDMDVGRVRERYRTVMRSLERDLGAWL